MSRIKQNLWLLIGLLLSLPSAALAIDKGEMLNELSKAQPKSIAIGMDVSGSMAERSQDSTKSKIEVVAELAREVVGTLKPGDQCVLLMFDSKPYDPVVIPINKEADRQRAADQIKAQIRNPQRMGTNIRWAHDNMLKIVLQDQRYQNQSYCVFLSDGYDDPVKKGNEGFAKFGAYYDETTSDEYKQYQGRLGQAHERGFVLYGVGVKFDAQGRPIGDHNIPATSSVQINKVAAPAVPPSTNPTVPTKLKTPDTSGMHAQPETPTTHRWWESGSGKTLLSRLPWVLLVLVIGYIYNIGWRRRYTVLLKVGSNPEKAFPMRVGKAISLGASERSFDIYDVSINGTKQCVARIRTEPFGKFSLQQMVGSDQASIMVGKSEVKNKVALHPDDLIEITIKSKQETNNHILNIPTNLSFALQTGKAKRRS